MEFEFLGLGLVRMLSTNEEKKEKRKKGWLMSHIYRDSQAQNSSAMFTRL